MSWWLLDLIGFSRGSHQFNRSLHKRRRREDHFWLEENRTGRRGRVQLQALAGGHRASRRGAQGGAVVSGSVRRAIFEEVLFFILLLLMFMMVVLLLDGTWQVAESPAIVVALDSCHKADSLGRGQGTGGDTGGDTIMHYCMMLGVVLVLLDDFKEGSVSDRFRSGALD